VRLFRARLDKLEVALASKADDVAEAVKAELRAVVAALPANNVVVLENQAHVARVSDGRYWARLKREQLGFLRQTIAPILRAASGTDFKALRFETDVIELSTALLARNHDAFKALRDVVTEQVAELPLGVNLVAKERDLIDAVLRPAWWDDVDDAKVRDLVARLAPLMRFRREDARSIVSLHLADLTAVRERVVVGPDGRDMPIATYRQRVEETVRQLLAENSVLQRLQAGEAVSDADLKELAELLRRQDPGIDEERLRKVYDVRRASFMKLIRHVLGVEPLERWPTYVTRRFEEFITEHTTYTAAQIRFLQTLRTFVIQRGQVDRRDLVEPPFTQLDPRGVRGVFPPRDIEEIMGFAGGLVA
jgi:type I restriction enzyme R subunit